MSFIDYKSPASGRVRRSGPPVWRIAALTLSFLPVILFLGHQIALVSPWGWRVSTQTNIEMPGNKTIGQQAALHVFAGGYGKRNDTHITAVYINCIGEHSAVSEELILDLTTSPITAQRFIDMKLKPAEPWSRELVTEFLVDQGYERYAAESLSDRPWEQVESIRAGRFSTLPRMRHSLRKLPWYWVPFLPNGVPLFAFISVMVWLAVSVVVAIVLMRRYRREIGRARKEVASDA